MQQTVHYALHWAIVSWCSHLLVIIDARTHTDTSQHRQQWQIKVTHTYASDKPHIWMHICIELQIARRGTISVLFFGEMAILFVHYSGSLWRTSIGQHKHTHAQFRSAPLWCSKAIVPVLLAAWWAAHTQVPCARVVLSVLFCFGLLTSAQSTLDLGECDNWDITTLGRRTSVGRGDSTCHQCSI